jgi:DNA-3-methyladenine glycosylase
MGPDDPASHSREGKRTARNSSMYLPYGAIYVYFVYGMHWCFNLVTGARDHGAAVLIRALEPTFGLETMEVRRNHTKPEMLCSGPARLCQAMGIDGKHNGGRLNSAGIVLLESEKSPVGIDIGPRIGISQAQDWPLRFTESGSTWLSKK